MTLSARDPEIRAILGKPFEEQLAFFRRRLQRLVPTLRWDDLMRSQHDRAFVVAGAAKADLLSDLAGAVDRALSTGTLDSFRKDFRKIVQRYGWDYTGEFNWRTRVIYKTNAAVSYAAARLQQLREGGFPFWMYKHGGSADPRPQHLAWDGLVLPSDHPFWATHSPPNGWGCSCRIVGLRDRDDARRLGGDPNKQLPDGWDEIDERTGAPIGIDRGWDYQPGATAEFDRQIDTTINKLPDEIRPIAAAEVAAIRSTLSVDEYVEAGRGVLASLPSADDPDAFVAALISKLAADVGISKPAKIEGRKSPGKDLVERASRLFPDSWTQATDRLGRLFVRTSDARGYQVTHDGVPGRLRLPGFGVRDVLAGDGFLQLRDEIGVAIHEYAHRLQAALPLLDDVFQQLHRRRTAGDPLRSLRILSGTGYGPNERTREDSYFDPYVGKEYGTRGALEVMAMAFETLLSPIDPSGYRRARFRELRERDPELFELAIGLLFRWRP